MNPVDFINEKIEEFKERKRQYNSWQNRYERLKNTEQNKKARNNFKRVISKVYAEEQLTEEQEAIVFTQEFHKLFLKNPTASKFPEFDEYEVLKNEETYIVNGFCDCTNSYGAQVREKHSYEVYKSEDEWACITDVGVKYLKYLLIMIILIALPSIITYCSMSSLF